MIVATALFFLMGLHIGVHWGRVPTPATDGAGRGRTAPGGARRAGDVQ
jgi:hypothetical protein